MSWEVQVDHEQCIGSGMCAGVASGLFQIVSGRSEPLQEEVPADDAEKALAAASCCPMEAITITNVATGETVYGHRD